MPVKKFGGTWPICNDFTNLNRACSKDYFSLLRIDNVVDATTRHKTLTYLDAYAGYNQIKMHLTYQEKIAVNTDRGLYCY